MSWVVELGRVSRAETGEREERGEGVSKEGVFLSLLELFALRTRRRGTASRGGLRTFFNLHMKGAVIDPDSCSRPSLSAQILLQFKKQKPFSTWSLPPFTTMVRLIVSGFGCFQGVTANPTAQLIDYLRNDANLSERLGAEAVSLCVLDVSARAADSFAEERLAAAGGSDGGGNGNGPLLVVHLGVDAGCREPSIALERCAYNECGFRCPDEDGVVLGGATAPCPRAPLGARLETCLDVEGLRARVEAARDARGRHYNVRVSEDAGRFLCNYVYARSLSALACRRAAAETTGSKAGRRRERGADALFVHVPPFSALSEEVQREALLDLLRALVELARAPSS